MRTNESPKMNPMTRRTFLSFLLASAAASACDPFPPASRFDFAEADARSKLAELEAESGGRLGVAALLSSGGYSLSHRASESFPMCSTFKLMLTAAVLRRSMDEPDFLGRHVGYTKADLLSYAPITSKHVAQGGMSVEALCDAAMRYSDNTAANLLLSLLGGPAAVTAYARSIGDGSFRLDRWEPELNTAIPGDQRDTTTPMTMARSLRHLALGDALAPAQRGMLMGWLEGNTTGAGKIRAGVPEGWRVGDKTGSGDYGTTNDVAVLLPPSGVPILLAVYLTQPEKDAKYRTDVLASAARIAIQAFS